MMAGAADDLIKNPAPTSWKQYKLKEKWCAIQRIKDLVSCGISCCPPCLSVEISPLYYHSWNRLMGKENEVNTSK
jgi:hypothetical protein